MRRPHDINPSVANAATRVVFLCIGLLWLFLPTSASGEWPRWRGPHGNGIVTDTNWNPAVFAEEPKILWRASVGVGYSSVAVSNGLAYTLGNSRGKDTVFCLDAQTGEVIWAYSYACGSSQYPGPRATPTVDGDRVYTLSLEGHLHAFDADTGEVIWFRHLIDDYRIRPPQWSFACSPVIHENSLILNAGAAGFALDKNSGEKLWDSGRGPGGYSTPVFYEHGDITAAAILSNQRISGVEIGSGDVIWSHPWRGMPDINGSDPVVYEQRVFVASGYGKGSSLIDFSGRERTIWESRYFQTHFSSFVLIDGYIYGNDGDARRVSSGVYRCIDFDTGVEMWSADLGFGSLIAVGEYLILLNSVGVITIVEASPEGFHQLSRAAMPRNQYWTPPAYSEQKLFVRNLRGDVFCVDLR